MKGENTVEFPQEVFVNLDDVNAYIRLIDSVNDQGEWQEVGVYRLHEIRRVRKVVEAKQ